METEQQVRTLWQKLKDHFNLLADKEDEQSTYASIRSGVDFRGANLWILIFAIFMASLGLNVNSTAVIIGAMLISPLMGPIIGMGFAVGVNDFSLFKRALKNYLIATLISVVTATVYFLLTPFNEAQSELLARTSPTLYDVFIALFGGAAGIVAIATRGKGNVLPGVAIATALMPPLCTAGFGLATGHIFYFLGAFYLFFINTVFIGVATFLGVRMMKFQKKVFVDAARERRVRHYLIAIITVTMIPAAIMTYSILRRDLQSAAVNRFVRTELNIPGTQVIDRELNDKEKTLRVVAVGREITPEVIRQAQSRLAQYKLGGFKLQIIQGSQSDSLQLTNFKLSAENSAQLIQNQSAQIHDLEQQLQIQGRFATVGQDLRPQLQILFPEVRSVALGEVAQAAPDSASNNRRYVVAIVQLQQSLSASRRAVLKKWLAERLQADSLRLLIP